MELIKLGLTTFLLFSTCLAYKPIIYMHGILAGPEESETMETFIQKVHPGTNVITIDAFNHVHSVEPMWTQVYRVKILFEDIMTKYPDGVHLICFSQGGIICRGVLSILPHNVDTFISLSSPQAGQYGDTEYLQFLFPNYLKENIYRYFYTDAGQKWSVANYWKDPHQDDLYRKYSNYLAVINNDTSSPLISEYKSNFLRLKKLVMIGGPDDGVITPWQSSQFGFYNDNNDVLPMTQQQYYKDDSFGLKTLQSRGGLTSYTIHGVKHRLWFKNETVFDCCIKPWLT